MNAILTAALALIAQLVPTAAGDTALIGTIIAGLEQIVPLLEKAYIAIAPIIKSIIATLRADPATLPAQLDALDALDAATDAAFEAAAVPQPGDPDYVAPAVGA